MICLRKQKMKVYIITKEPFPNGMAATNRIKCYARAIHDGGMDCEVTVCGSTEIKGMKIKNTKAVGIYEGVPFRYIGGTTTGSSKSFVRKIIQFRNLIYTAFYLYHNLKAGDILFLIFEFKIKWTLFFMKIAKMKKAFCVRDLCELPYGTGAETEQANSLRKLTLEKQFPKLNGVISISDTLLELAKKHTLPTCTHIKIPIMVEFEKYETIKHYDETTTPYIFHAGTLSQKKDGILGMIEAFGMAKQHLSFPIKYILTGKIEESSHPNELRKIIQYYNLQDSIEFVGYLSQNQIKNYLEKASLVISNRPKSIQDYYGFSTKVGEYLASGTPLITTYWGEVVNWLKDGENAYIIEPENTIALADKIVYVFTHPEDSKKIGYAGQIICRNYFDYRVWSKPLVEYLNQLDQQPK